ALRVGGRPLPPRHNSDLLDQVDEASRLDERLREITNERDDLRRQVNELSKEVGQLRRTGDTESAEKVMNRSRELGESERVLAAEHDRVSEDLRQLLLRIPNIPHTDAPDGGSDEDHPMVTGPVNMPDSFAEHQLVPHWESATALGILDNERATKVSGAMFTMQRGLGATLARALCQLALDNNA